MKKEKISREIIRAYALENAISHKGKTIEGPVINALFKQGLEKQDIPLVIQDIQKIIKDVNALSFEKQQK